MDKTKTVYMSEEEVRNSGFYPDFSRFLYSHGDYLVDMCDYSDSLILDNDGNEIGFAHRAIKVNCHVAPEWKDDVLNGRIRATELKLLVHPKFLDADSDAGWNEMFDWEQAIFVRSVFGDDLAKLVAMQRKR